MKDLRSNRGVSQRGVSQHPVWQIQSSYSGSKRPECSRGWWWWWSESTPLRYKLIGWQTWVGGGGRGGSGRVRLRNVWRVRARMRCINDCTKTTVFTHSTSLSAFPTETRAHNHKTGLINVEKSVICPTRSVKSLLDEVAPREEFMKVLISFITSVQLLAAVRNYELTHWGSYEITVLQF